MKWLVLSSFLASAVAFAPQSSRTSSSLASSKADLESFAEKCNPVVKFFDPMGLAEGDFWDMGNDATISWLRASEIKHSRVAMAAFVGFCVQSNFVFPWPQHLDGTGGSTAMSPEQQWDALPEAAKWQIFALIGFLEVWDEISGTHYLKGRQPGKYPPLDGFRDNVHFILDLYDPFGFNKNMSDETKARRLVAETNNGRLAMIGIFGFLSSDVVPGSVPGLDQIRTAVPYSGNVMIPFEGNFHLDPIGF